MSKELSSSHEIISQASGMGIGALYVYSNNSWEIVDIEHEIFRQGNDTDDLSENCAIYFSELELSTDNPTLH